MMVGIASLGYNGLVLQQAIAFKRKLVDRGCT
jgi:hypothetical protein